MRQDPQQMNSLALAYIGDAVYEVYVRTHLIDEGQVRPHKLHHHAVRFVSAEAQASIIHHWLDSDMLSEEEVAVVKRGRNAKSKSTPRNMAVIDYRFATAFEALIGFHYLMEHETRLNELLEDAVRWINGSEEMTGQKET